LFVCHDSFAVSVFILCFHIQMIFTFFFKIGQMKGMLLTLIDMGYFFPLWHGGVWVWRGGSRSGPLYLNT
jgi:hypothetical protein